MEGCSSDNLESIEEQLFEGLKLKSQEEATVVLLRTMMLRLDSRAAMLAAGRSAADIAVFDMMCCAPL